MAARHLYSVWHEDSQEPQIQTRIKGEAITYARKTWGPQERREAITITCHRLFVLFEEAQPHCITWDRD